MAHCKHNRESHGCGLCEVERTKEQFGGVYNGQVGARGIKVSPMYKPEVERLTEDELHQDEMAREYVLNSFGVKYETEEDGGNE